MANSFPFMQAKDFLEPDFNQEILQYAIEKQGDFANSKTGSKIYYKSDNKQIKSSALFAIGSLKARIEQKST